jgi:ferredoxin-NADP reductase
MAPARIAWRLAAVTDVLVETPTAKTLVLDVPGWPGHLAGQHVDIRLTADLLVGLGHDTAAIHLERFGPPGG